MMALLNHDRFTILTDRHGRFLGIALVSSSAPAVGPGFHGFLWVDTGLDGTVDAPVWKYYDEATGEWVTIGGAGGGMTLDEHTAIGDGSPHHAAVTLGAGSDPALSLDGQELTFGGVYISSSPPPLTTSGQLWLDIS
jgi:hypothetical protein